MLINWFKENFKNRDYQRELKKTRSPRVRQNIPDPVAMIEGERNRNPDASADQWGVID